MMKTLSSPRRVYTRNKVTHVCYDGRTYGPGARSTVMRDLPVHLEKMASDGGRARVTVTQTQADNVVVTETWRSVVVPAKSKQATAA